jgi:hypothetical protein
MYSSWTALAKRRLKTDGPDPACPETPATVPKKIKIVDLIPEMQQTCFWIGPHIRRYCQEVK